MFMFSLFPMGILIPIYMFTVFTKKKITLKYNDDKLPIVVMFRYEYEKHPNEIKKRISLVSTDEHPVQIIDDYVNKVFLFEIRGLTEDDLNNYKDYFSKENIELHYFR